MTPSSHFIFCCPLLLLPLIFPIIGVFSNESAFCIMYPKYWSLSRSPLNEYSGLISFRINWLDLLACQGTLKSPLQNHSLKASVLWHSAFFYCPAFTSVHDYWTTHSFDYTNLCWQCNVSTFGTLSRFVITFLPRSKCLLISWLQSPSTVILEHNKIKPVTVSIVSPIYLPWRDKTRCHDLCFLNVEL